MLYTDFAVMLGLLYGFLPFMVLPIYASLEKLDFRLVEAGYDLYATRGRVLRRIIIPLAKPGIVAGCLLVFIPALGAYVTPLMLGGGKHLMIGNLIALQFGSARNWPFGSALALILMAGVLWRCCSMSATPPGKATGAPWLSRLCTGRGTDLRRSRRRRGSGPARRSISSTSRASATDRRLLPGAALRTDRGAGDLLLQRRHCR